MTKIPVYQTWSRDKHDYVIYSQTCLEQPLLWEATLCFKSTWSKRFVIVYNKCYWWFTFTVQERWPLKTGLTLHINTNCYLQKHIKGNKNENHNSTLVYICKHEFDSLNLELILVSKSTACCANGCAHGCYHYAADWWKLAGRQAMPGVSLHVALTRLHYQPIGTSKTFW